MRILRNEGGFVLVTAVIIMVLLTLIGIFATNTALFELKISGNDKVAKNTLLQAESGAILSTEVLEQNLNCATGFLSTGSASGTQVADLNGIVRVWSRSTNGRNDLAMYLDPRPWTTDACTPTDPDTPNISYPISSIASGQILTDTYLGGNTQILPGGSLIMAAGYERKGKSAAGGGTIKLYDIISRHRGLINSQSTVFFGWRHVIGDESDCNY